MASGSAIPGTRVGAGPSRWDERATPVARQTVVYWCSNGHETSAAFAEGVEPPQMWECPHCGQPAGTDAKHPPPLRRTEPYKTHLAYVKERRSEADGAAILAEALAALHQRRR